MVHSLVSNFCYRSATYLRVLPKNSRSQEGKRHVNAVPVKLIRSQTDQHKQHIDTSFATASLRYLECLASLLGPQEVFFLSQDDKARVPIGIVAANKQAPLLMHMEYRVMLPDHDWVIAEKHKLIPSVYAGICIRSDGMGEPNAVTYSGPTHIAIRSGKHSSSTAGTHASDFERLIDLEHFQSLARTENGKVKPVVIMSVDGGPDENPRYHKVIAFAITHFKKYDLDALFIATNAPGRSAYNRVERRMAPLSRELAGLILPPDHFGSHLDTRGKTTDPELELANFAHAGQILAEVWSSMIIDGHDVEATYIEPTETQDPEEVDMVWYKDHVRESQYFLQIVKCQSISCCDVARSSLRKVLPTGFFPPPIRVSNRFGGLAVNKQTDTHGHFASLFVRRTLDTEPTEATLPYDYFCPSVMQQLDNRICKKCNLYHASKKSMMNHAKSVHSVKTLSTEKRSVRPVRIAARRARELMCIISDTETKSEDAEWISEGEIDTEEERDTDPVQEDSGFRVIGKLDDWLVSPWSHEK